MFIVLCLCLLYPLMIHVIQSYVIYGSEIHKKIKMLTRLNEQGSQHLL